MLSSFRHKVRGLDEPTALQWVDLQTWLPRDILRKADRMSMAHSLELRVPFLDRQRCPEFELQP